MLKKIRKTNLFANFINEIKFFDEKQKKFALLISLAMFLVSIEYAITRPCSNSIFLHYYGAKYFPYIWIATIPVNFMVISLYNYCLPRYGCKKVWAAISIITILSNATLAKFSTSYNFLSIYQCIWKDIYILLMYKQLWSLIHLTLNKNVAKYVFGFFFSAGGIAAIFGGTISGFLASHVGTKNLLFSTFFIYVTLFIIYLNAYKYSKASEMNLNKDPFFQKIPVSKYLKYILLIILFMQVSIAIADFQFNSLLEKSITDIDLRTEYIGKVMTIAHIVMTFLQFSVGILFLNTLGIKNTHLFLPFSLLINALLSAIVPVLSVISYSFIYVKSMEYSVYNILREMLYTNMNDNQKFKIKAFIDVFGQRSAKAFAAFLLIFMQQSYLINYLWVFSAAATITWVYVIYKLFEKEPVLSN